MSVGFGDNCEKVADVNVQFPILNFQFSFIAWH